MSKLLHHWDDIYNRLPLIMDFSGLTLDKSIDVEEELINWCDWFHVFMIGRMLSKRPCTLSKMPNDFMEASEMVGRGLLSEDEEKFSMLEPVWDRMIKESIQMYGKGAEHDVRFYIHCFSYFLSDIIKNL